MLPLDEEVTVVVPLALFSRVEVSAVSTGVSSLGATAADAGSSVVAAVPPVSSCLDSVVPVNLRLVFSRCCSLIWAIYKLMWLRRRRKEQEQRKQSLESSKGSQKVVQTRN